MAKRILTIKNTEIPFLRDAIRKYSMRGYSVYSRMLSKGPCKCTVEIECGEYIFEGIRKEFDTLTWMFN